MKLRKDSWIHLAKRLSPNSRKYHDHEDCGSGRTLVVSTGEHGWSGHCFRCNLDGYESYGERNLAELQDVNFGLLNRSENNFQYGKCSLPLDFTTEIPDYAAIWLYKAGVFKETAEAYGFGWSESIKRVVLPIYKDRELLFMQARSIDRKPKYLNCSAVPKTSVLFHATGTHSLSRVVITEDILSAVRVGVHLPCVSTLGTSLSDEQAYQLVQQYERATVWYDSDEAGRKGTAQAMRKLKMLGMQVDYITSSLDAKCYSNRKIQEFLLQVG